MITYPSQVKTKVVKIKEHVQFIKALARGASTKTLAGIVHRDATLRPVLNTLICKQLSRECTSLCSDHLPSILRQTSTDDLTGLSWNELAEEWKKRSTLLYKVLDAIAHNVHVQHRQPSPPTVTLSPAVLLAGSALLFCRNPKMCRVQLATGLVLDHGGATDEVGV